MIKILKADIFKVKSDALIHCANCYCKMKSGIAATISKLYPMAVDADNATICGDINKLGNFSHAIGTDGKIIYNLYGQYNYGTDSRKLNYEAFYSGLDKIHADMLHKQLKHVTIPYKIGCGLAGGNWTIVQSMIDVIFTDSSIDVTICDNS